MRGKYGSLVQEQRGVGTFRGIVSKENLEFIQMMAALESKKETTFCNQVLNDRFDELRCMYQKLRPTIDISEKDVDSLFSPVCKR